MNGPLLQPLRQRLLAACAALLLGACAGMDVAEYQGTEVPAKASWSQPPADISAAEAIAPDWWRAFGDPVLDRLVDEALAANHDLKVLAARIQVANAGLGEARAGALPILDVGAGASFEKSTGQPFSKQFNLATQVNWELDVWGKVEKGVQAQTAEFRATEADWRAGWLSLAASVSTTYFQIRQLDEQIVQQERSLEKNRQILATFEAMHANGLVPRTQVLRQQAELSRLGHDLVELQRLRGLADNALATLLGRPAGDFRLPPGNLQQAVHLPAVPAGLPAQLLERRPDIVAAEFRVLEAYNLAGQAKLAQLPSISLTARGGTSSLALGDLLRSFTFGFLPSINLPGLDPGVRARVKTSEAQTRVAEESYRRTVMAAFEEVENALVNLDAHRRQRDELQRQIDDLAVVSAQVEAQLQEGLVSQLEVFETERSLLSAQLALLANHQQILADTVTLYKALGGGWPAVAVENAGK